MLLNLVKVTANHTLHEWSMAGYRPQELYSEGFGRDSISSQQHTLRLVRISNILLRIHKYLSLMESECESVCMYVCMYV